MTTRMRGALGGSLLTALLASVPGPAAAQIEIARTVQLPVQADFSSTPAGFGPAVLHSLRPLVVRVLGQILAETPDSDVVAPSFVLSLALDMGNHLDKTAEEVVRRHVVVPENWTPVLDEKGYTFARATFGFELGDPGHAALYLRAGVSRLAFDIPTVAASAGRGRLVDPVAWLMPTVNIGLLVRF